ncbi:MAG: pseudouridine synthase [Gemmatimonadales bacterium]
MRLQRALARAGVASRRSAEDLIRAGRVTVNGSVAELGMSVDPDKDVILVGRKRIRRPVATWLALNKPVGYVVTRKDPHGRPTVFELVPEVPGLTYVGRLDINTSGLLLFTTDGAAANRLMHPRYEVERTYQVLVQGRSTNEIKRLIARPTRIDERDVKILRHSIRAAAASTEITLVLAEGRYRIVRRLCGAWKLKVAKLIRLSHGPVRLGRLPVGKWRRLTAGEIEAISAVN